MPPTTHELGLGIVFTGQIDQSLQQAVNFVKQLLAQGPGLNKLTQALQQVAAGKAQVGKEAVLRGKQIGVFTDHFERLTRAFQVVTSYGIATGIIFAVTNAFRAGTGAIVQYDQALRNLQAIIGATENEIGVLGKKILEIASRSKFSMKEVADAAIILGQAGLETEQVVAALDGIMNLAQGTLSKVEPVADLVTTALRSFNLTANDTTQITDIMANAINKSKLDVDKLRVAFNYVAPVAYTAGLTLQETTAAMMLLANAGIRASTIGTSLRQVIARLIAPSDKLRETFAAYNIDLDEINPRLNDFGVIIDRLSKVITSADKAFQLFGLRGAPAVAVLTTMGKEGFDAMLKYTQEMGSAAEMAALQLQGLQVAFQQTINRLEVAAIKIGEAGLTGALKLLADTLRGTAELLINFVDTGVGRFITAFVTLEAVIGGAILIINYFRATLWKLAVEKITLHFADLIDTVRRFNAMMELAREGVISWRTAGTGFIATLKGIGSAIAGLLTPWGVLAVVVGGFIALFASLNSLAEKRRQAMMEEYKQHVNNAEVYRTYAKRILEVKGKAEEYEALVKRMIFDHKELAPVVMETANSAEALAAALNRFASEEMRKALAEVIGLLHLLAANKDIEAGLDALTGAGEAWGVLVPKTAADMKELMKFAYGVAKEMQEVGMSSKSTKDEILNFLNAVKKMPENSDIFVAFVMHWLKAFDAGKKSLQEYKVEILDLPKRIQDAYKKGDAITQYYILRMYANMKKSEAAVGKNLKETFEETGMTIAMNAAAMEEAYLKELMKGVEDIYKGKLPASKVVEEQLRQIGDMEKKYGDERRKSEKEAREDYQKKLKVVTDKEYEDIRESHAAIKKEHDIYQGNLLKAQEVHAGKMSAAGALRREIAEKEQKSFDDKSVAFEKAKWALMETVTKEGWDHIYATYNKNMQDITNRIKKFRDDVKGPLTPDQETWLTGIERWLEEQAAVGLETEIVDRQTKIRDKLLGIWVAYQKSKFALEERNAAETSSLYYEYGEKRLDFEIAQAERILAQKKRDLVAIEKVTSVDDTRRLDATKEVLDAETVLWDAQTKKIIFIRKKMIDQLTKDMDEYWDDQLAKTKARGATAQDIWGIEAQRLENVEGMGFFAGIKAALLKVASQAKTVAGSISEYFQDAFKKIADTVADTLTDSMLGAKKDIGEIWRDLLKDMLRAWNRMVMEMAMNALFRMIISSMGGAGTSYDPALGKTVPGPAPRHHKGAAIGIDSGPRLSVADVLGSILPRFHKGLGADEYLSVLKRGEVVFTPGQMKVLGSVIKENAGGSSSLSINVPITVDDPMRQKRLVSNLRTNIEAEVRRTLRLQTAY